MKHAAKALIRDESGKILVLRRSETHPRFAHDVDLPGGLIEDGESTEAGLAREILEETGLEMVVAAEDLRHSWQSFWGQKQDLYEVNYIGNPDVVISWEHEAYEWLSDEELASTTAEDEYMLQVQKWLQRDVGSN